MLNIKLLKNKKLDNIYLSAIASKASYLLIDLNFTDLTKDHTSHIENFISNIDIELIYNPMTAAPGFKVSNVFVLPGVPKIMEQMLQDVLLKLKKGKPKKITTINTDLFESKIAPSLNDIQNQFTDCSIGSYPYFNLTSKTGGVNIVISSWTMNSLTEIEKEIIKMIKFNGGNYSIV